MSLSYCTPEGHAVMQAMHPRQVSKWRTKVSVMPTSPWVPNCIRRMRPRGESISCPQSAYVGHDGRQKPQCTHLSMSVSSGGCCWSKMLGLVGADILFAE